MSEELRRVVSSRRQVNGECEKEPCEVSIRTDLVLSAGIGDNVRQEQVECGDIGQLPR